MVRFWPLVGSKIWTNAPITATGDESNLNFYNDETHIGRIRYFDCYHKIIGLKTTHPNKSCPFIIK